MIRLWFAALGLGWQLAIEAALLATVAGGVWAIHHHIDKGGYDRCQGEVKAAGAARETQAQTDIAKSGVKYAQIHQELRAAPDYMRPGSPLVVSAIGRMPRPHPPAR